MNARAALIRELGVFLRQIDTDISNKLADDKSNAERTPQQRHKVGILQHVSSRVKEIATKYTIQLKPADRVELKNNVVYVEWDGKVLNYTFRNAIGEASEAEEYKGSITMQELPELAVKECDLTESDIQPLAIDILTILSARNQIKFTLDDLGSKHKDEVLREVLKARDHEFEVWQGRIKKILKSFYKREFDNNLKANEVAKIKENDQNLPQDQIDEKVKSVRERYVADQLNETVNLEDLYLAVFNLHYLVTRQMFCLKQFSGFEYPENLIAEAGSLLKVLDLQKDQIERCGRDMSKLNAEYDAFQRAFESLTKHLRGDDKAPEFDINDIPVDCDALKSLVSEFKTEMGRLNAIELRRESMRAEAQAAAKSGDSVALRQHLREIQLQINAINLVQSNLDDKIKKYVAALHEKVGKVAKLKNGVEVAIVGAKPSVSSVPTMFYLKQLAVFAKAENDGSDGLQPLEGAAQTLKDQCAKLSGILSGNAWRDTGEGLCKKQSQLQAMFDDYIQHFLPHAKNVDAVVMSLSIITNQQNKIGKLCDDIPTGLRSLGNQWQEVTAGIALRWRKPYEELLHETHLNRSMAFMRRHWWKMLIGGVALAALAAPVVFMVLGLSLLMTAGIVAIGLVAGAIAGAGVGRATDKCCPVEEDFDDRLIKRTSSADIIVATHDPDAVEMEDRGKPELITNPFAEGYQVSEAEVSEKALDSSSLASTSTLSAPPGNSYNPF